jgi:hypothetical protein
MRKIWVGLLGSLFLLAEVCIASETVKESDPYRFSGPVVCKVDWNTRSLLTRDLNGDGLQDLLVLNNDLGRINLFYQRDKNSAESMKRISLHPDRWEPVLENHPFYSTFVVTGFAMLALGVGDVDGDGFVDLVFSGKDEPLTILFQDKDGEFRDRLFYRRGLDILPRPDAITIIDFDGDGRNDIMVSAKDSLEMIRVDDSRNFLGTDSFAWSSSPVHWQRFVDLDQDGDLDLLYYTDGGGIRPLRVRYQVGEARLGPEQGLLLNKQNTLQHLPSGDGKNDNFFVGINRSSGSIETYRLEVQKNGNEMDALMAPFVYPFQNEVAGSFGYAVGDLNHDGFEDVAIADPKGAAIELLMGDREESFLWAGRFASLKDIDFLTIGAFQQKGIGQLLIFSSKENLIGIAEYNSDQGIHFPELLQFEDEIICSQGDDTDGDGVSEIYSVTKNRSDYSLAITRWIANEKSWKTENLKLGKMPRKPKGLYFFDLNHDGLKDFLMLIPREPARIFFQNKEGVWEEKLEDSTIRRSLFMDVLAENLGQGDVDGNGRVELLLGAEGFIRSFTINEEGKLVVVGQYNARDGSSSLRIPFTSGTEDGRKLLVAYDQKEQSFQFLKQSRSGFDYLTDRRADSMGPIKIEEIRNGDQSAFLVFTDKKMFFYHAKKEYSKLKKIGHYETYLKGVRHTELTLGQFHSSKGIDILAFDGINNVLEMIDNPRQDLEEWVSGMHFNIFDKNLHYNGPTGGQYEPREVVVSDLNHDGRDDFAFLVHDRILVYFQE